MYMCVRRINFVFVPTFFRLDFDVLTVYYFDVLTVYYFDVLTVYYFDVLTVYYFVFYLITNNVY